MKLEDFDKIIKCFGYKDYNSFVKENFIIGGIFRKLVNHSCFSEMLERMYWLYEENESVIWQ